MVNEAAAPVPLGIRERPGLMAEQSWLVPLFCPPAVAVHDDCHMDRDSSGIGNDGINHDAAEGGVLHTSMISFSLPAAISSIILMKLSVSFWASS